MKAKVINSLVGTVLVFVFVLCGWCGYHTYKTRGFGQAGGEHHQIGEHHGGNFNQEPNNGNG